MRQFSFFLLSVVAVLSIMGASAPTEELENKIPKNQKPILKVFPPSVAEQSKPGTGKFVIFTREQVGKNWDFIAGAWECIPSQPKIPVTKRVEFGHSSWNAVPLLDELVRDGSDGKYPQFVSLQVDSGDTNFTVNLYDINYRTWDVRCIWQGSRLSAFGVIDGDILCRANDDWVLISSGTGQISRNAPFAPNSIDGAYWLVRKAGEVEGCWSYDFANKKYIAHFGPVARPRMGYSEMKLSPDGKSQAWILASMPHGGNWRGGMIVGQLILQQDGEKDISVPVEMYAVPGSGVPVIPLGTQLSFSSDDKVQFRVWKVAKGAKVTEDQVWTVDSATGKVEHTVIPDVQPPEVEHAVLDGVPVPDYLREDVKGVESFGRGGLAAAFLVHLGIIKKTPDYPDCTVGVSPDGRHILFRATDGPLVGVFIYGDLVTKQIVRWKVPKELDDNYSQEFVWVETP